MHKLYQIQQLTLKCVSFSARLASGLSVWSVWWMDEQLRNNYVNFVINPLD